MDVPLTDRLRYAGCAITALLLPRGTAAGPILLLAEVSGKLEADHQLATMRASQEPIVGILGGATMGITEERYPLHGRKRLAIDDGRVMVTDIVLWHQQVAVLDPQFLKSLSRFAEPRGPIRRPREDPEPERDRADHRSDEKIRHPLPPLLLPKFTECRSRLCLELRERLAKETHRRAYAGYWRNITATPE